MSSCATRSSSVLGRYFSIQGRSDNGCFDPAAAAVAGVAVFIALFSLSTSIIVRERVSWIGLDGGERRRIGYGW